MGRILTEVLQMIDFSTLIFNLTQFFDLIESQLLKLTKLE